MHFEQSAILTVHNHVITRNPRISVTHDKHDKHKTWFLHISNVQEEDKGRYMCQINTVTAKTQFGYLHVVGKLRSNDEWDTFYAMISLHYPCSWERKKNRWKQKHRCNEIHFPSEEGTMLDNSIQIVFHPVWCFHLSSNHAPTLSSEIVFRLWNRYSIQSHRRRLSSIESFPTILPACRRWTATPRRKRKINGSVSFDRQLRRRACSPRKWIWWNSIGNYIHQKRSVKEELN